MDTFGRLAAVVIPSCRRQHPTFDIQVNFSTISIPNFVILDVNECWRMCKHVDILILFSQNGLLTMFWIPNFFSRLVIGCCSGRSGKGDERDTFWLMVYIYDVWVQPVPGVVVHIPLDTNKRGNSLPTSDPWQLKRETNCRATAVPAVQFLLACPRPTDSLWLQWELAVANKITCLLR